jgi:hypothetical protein
MRLPDAAVGAAFELLRNQCEGAPGYVPPPPADDPMKAIRVHVKSLNREQLEAAYKECTKKLSAPVVHRATDTMRQLAIGGGHPGAAQMNRLMRSLGRGHRVNFNFLCCLRH